MSSEDVELVRRGYAAFSAGDVPTLRELTAEDATWTVPGNAPISGVKQGRDAILAYFGELASRTDGTFKVTLVDVAGGESYVFAHGRFSGTRNGTDYESTDVNRFQIENGQVKSVQQYFEDTAAHDAFWA